MTQTIKADLNEMTQWVRGLTEQLKGQQLNATEAMQLILAAQDMGEMLARFDLMVKSRYRSFMDTHAKCPCCGEEQKGEERYRNPDGLLVCLYCRDHRAD